MDILTTIGAVRREVAVGRAGRPRRRGASSPNAAYPAPREDVWEALTNGRAHLPLADRRSAETSASAAGYQLEGNASGTITACDPPATPRGDLGVRRRGELDRRSPGGRRRRHRSCAWCTRHTSTTPAGTEFGPGRRRGRRGTSRCSAWLEHLAAGPESIPSHEPRRRHEGRDHVHAPEQRRLVPGLDRQPDARRRRPAPPPTERPPAYTARLNLAGPCTPSTSSAIRFAVASSSSSPTDELTSGADHRMRCGASSASRSLPSSQHLKVLRDSGFVSCAARRSAPALPARRGPAVARWTPGSRSSAGSGTSTSTPSAPSWPAVGVVAARSRATCQSPSPGVSSDS